MALRPEEIDRLANIAAPDRRWYAGVKDPIYLTIRCVRCFTTKTFSEPDMVLAQRGDGGAIKCPCGSSEFTVAWVPLSVLVTDDGPQEKE